MATEQAIPADIETNLLAGLRDLKDLIADQPRWQDNEGLKAVYVSLLTVEGAIVMGDVKDLADRNAAFCVEKHDELMLRN